MKRDMSSVSHGCFGLCEVSPTLRWLNLLFSPQPWDGFSYRNFSFQAFDAVLLFIECSKCKNVQNVKTKEDKNFTSFGAAEACGPSNPFILVFTLPTFTWSHRRPSASVGHWFQDPTTNQNLHASDFISAKHCRHPAHAHGKTAMAHLFPHHLFLVNPQMALWYGRPDCLLFVNLIVTVSWVAGGE